MSLTCMTLTKTLLSHQQTCHVFELTFFFTRKSLLKFKCIPWAEKKIYSLTSIRLQKEKNIYIYRHRSRITCRRREGIDEKAEKIPNARGSKRGKEEERMKNEDMKDLEVKRNKKQKTEMYFLPKAFLIFVSFLGPPKVVPLWHPIFHHVVKIQEP